MATRVGRGKMRLAAFDGPSPKTPYRRKNLADISYTDRVIANCVPNFIVCVYFTHLPASPLGGICIKFCMTGPLADIINPAKFYLNRVRGFDSVGVEFLAFP